LAIRVSKYLRKSLTRKKYLNKAIIAADASTSERVKIHVRKNTASLLCHNKEFQACQTLLLETILFVKSYKMQRD
jgi:hypothetical protein